MFEFLADIITWLFMGAFGLWFLLRFGTPEQRKKWRWLAILMVVLSVLQILNALRDKGFLW